MSGPGQGQGQGARVHDLGYERYDGPRRPQSTRYRTIIRHVMTSSWRGFWRMKAWVITAAITTITVGTIMYVNKGLSQLARGGPELGLTDKLLPMSFSFFVLSALPLSLTVLAAIVANDLRTGAFEFYFARPVRSRDYVVGKIGGAFAILSPILIAGPVLLALFRVGLAGSGQLGATLPLILRAAVVGVVATAAYATVPVAFSAISSRKRHTLAAWAAFYFMIGGVVQLAADETGVSELVVLSLPKAVEAFCYEVFDVPPLMGAALPSGWIALAALAGYVAVAIGVIYWRVSSAQRAGLGGG